MKLEAMNAKKHTIIYHDRCADGSCSMCVLHEYLQKQGITETTMVPAEYHLVDNILSQNFTGQQVWFVDFSLKPDEMSVLSNKAKNITVIDHHKGVLENYHAYITQKENGFLKGKFKPNVELILDMDRSAALMVWDYLNSAPGSVPVPAPRAVQYISDGDLFRHNLPETKDFSSRLAKDDFSEKTMHKLIHASDAEIDRYVAEGRVLLQPYLDRCEKAAQTATNVRIKYEGQSYDGYLVFSDRELRNDVARLIYDKTNRFVVVVTDFDGKNYTLSFRSSNKVEKKEMVNVLEIAKIFGGSGHENAAGATIDKTTFENHFLTVPKEKLLPRFKI